MVVRAGQAPPLDYPEGPAVPPSSTRPGKAPATTTEPGFYGPAALQSAASPMSPAYADSKRMSKRRADEPASPLSPTFSEKQRTSKRLSEGVDRLKELDALATGTQILYLVVVLIQSIIVTTMVGIVFSIVEDQVINLTPTLRATDIYLAVFILAGTFQLLFALDSLRLRNVIQLISLLAFLIVMLVYGALLHGQLHKTIQEANTGWDSKFANPQCDSVPQVNLHCFDGTTPLFTKISPYLIVVPVILGVSLLVQAFLTYRLYFEWGWVDFKKIGASRELQRCYRWYLSYTTLLKLTAFFTIAFAVQLLILATSRTNSEFALTIAALPISIVLLMFAGMCVRMEWRMGMPIVFAGEVAGITYFIYKIVRLWSKGEAGALGYGYVRPALTVFAAISLALLLALTAVSIKCYINFGKGLRLALPERRSSVRSSRRFSTDGKANTEKSSPWSPQSRRQQQEEPDRMSIE